MPKYSPYRKTTVDLYRAAGWSDIFPIFKTNETVPLYKSPPATGYTGYDAKTATDADHAKWMRRAKHDSIEKMANIAWHVEPGYLVIDVDQYGAKRGSDLLGVLVQETGVPLPPTLRTTSRGADMLLGGKLIYKLPEGVDGNKVSWRGNPVPGVELLHAGHRYMVMYPSRNATNDYAMERWYRNNTELVPQKEVPSLDEAATLPVEWVDVLSTGKERNELSKSGLTDDQKMQWLNSKEIAKEDICSKMQKVLDKCIEFLSETEEGTPNTAHEAMLHATWQLINLTNEGHRGALEALELYAEAWTDELNTGRHTYRSDGMAAGEWRRALYAAVDKTLGTGDKQAQAMEACFCSEDGAESNDKVRPAKTIGYEYKPDVFDFARRFVDMWGEHIRCAAGYSMDEAWFVWTGSGWDNEGGLYRVRKMVEGLGRKWEEEAMVAVESAREEYMAIKAKRKSGDKVSVEEQEAEEVYKGAKGHRAKVMRLLESSGVADTLEFVRNHPKVAVPADRFDNDESVLACANGVLELGREGVLFREQRPDDYCSNNTGVAYDPDATSAMWKDYLDTFVPDLEVRNYLQEVAGYILVGRNFKRKGVFLYGPTSSGKSTFPEMMAATLGPKYAGPFNLTIFRGNQDEKPRADIVEALPMRFIYASEASNAWNLHADQFKKATGNDTMKARRPYAKGDVVRRPSFTPVISTNNVPRIVGFDEATLRRLIVIPFNETVAIDKNHASRGQRVEVSDFADRMKDDDEARQAVLAWAVEGYVRFAERGREFPEEPMEVVKAKIKFTEGISQTNEFLAECCEFGEVAEYKAMKEDLYAVYTHWHRVYGGDGPEKAMSMKMFATSLNEKPSLEEARVRNPDSDAKDSKVRIIRGIRLRAEWMERVSISGNGHSFNSLSR